MNTSTLLSSSSVIPHDLVTNAAVAGPGPILVGLFATACGIAASHALHRVVSGIGGFETQTLPSRGADPAAYRSFGAAIPNINTVTGVYHADTTNNYQSGFAAALSLSFFIQLFADGAAFTLSQDQGTALAITAGMAVVGGLLPTFLMKVAQGKKA